MRRNRDVEIEFPYGWKTSFTSFYEGRTYPTIPLKPPPSHAHLRRGKSRKVTAFCSRVTTLTL